jgi:beta-glucosidase
VLLKNENNTLPLKKDIGTLAVIGPNADQWLMLLGNYNGVPSDPVTPLRGIREKLTSTQVLYAQGCELAKGMPTYKTIPRDVLFTGSETGLKGEFFNNTDFSGTPLFTSADEVIDVNWSDKAPRHDMDDDSFSVRWSGELVPDKTAIYQLGFVGTCNTRLYLNDSLVARTIYHFRDEYGDPRLRKSSPIKLEAGKRYKIVIEAIETYADAQVQLVWARPQPGLKEEAIKIARQADVVVMCMGLTARMEGEEMDIVIDGFRAGDRTKIELPAAQQELIREIQSLGKPVVLVLLNGSALAINWETRNIPAILEAWYPGQAAGHAIADVLVGDYNPGGKLPVTFYKSINDLPPFSEYEMKGQTYRFFKGEPLFPFGHGLSYTTFEYSGLEIGDRHNPGDSVALTVNVKNSGPVAGDEVVQVYLSHVNAPMKVPVRTLVQFQRVTLHPGEDRRISFTLPPDVFSVINDDGKKTIFSGKYELFVGGGQPESGMIRWKAPGLGASVLIAGM